MSTIKRRTTLFLVLAVCFSLLCIPAAKAYATDPSSDPELPVSSLETLASSSSSATSFLSGGNQFVANANVDNDIEGDLFWAGSGLTFDKTVGGNVFVAGSDLDLTKATIGQDLFAAGQTIKVGDSTLNGSIFAAGETIKLSGATKARAVYAAGSTIVVSGDYLDVNLTGENLSFLGTSAGDVHISGDNVTIGSDAKVAGTLFVESPTKPTIPNAQNVPNLQWTAPANDSSENDAEILAGMGVASAIILTIVSIISTLVCALLLRLFFRRAVDDSRDMIKGRTGAVIGTGVVAAFVAPLAFFILCGLGVTFPLAIGLLLGMLIVTTVAVPFTAAALSPLVFKRMNKYGATAIGALIIGVVGAIPLLGGLVYLCCFVYMLGYILQAIFLRMKAQPGENNGDGAPFGPAPVGVPIVPASTGQTTVPLANTPMSPTGAAIPTTGVPVPAVAPEVTVPLDPETAAPETNSPEVKPGDETK